MELYDLINDPFEQKNLIRDPSYEQVAEQMHLKLKELQLQALGLD